MSTNTLTASLQPTMTSAGVVHVAEHISNDEAVALSLDTLRQQALQKGGLQRSAGTAEDQPSRREAWLSLLDLSHLAASLSEPMQSEADTLDTDEALARHLAALEMTGNTSAAAATTAESEASEWHTAHSKRSKRRARGEASEGQLDLPNGSNGSSTAAVSANGAGSATSSASVNGGGAPSEHNEATQSNGSSKAKKKKKRKAKKQTASAELSSTPHKDESQVELDVKRSFVGEAWAQIVNQDQRPLRRRQLTSIVTRVLRAHPMLSYYQGYHDVISVLLVCLSPTLPEAHDAEVGEEALWSSEEEGEMIAQAAERLSLHWLRDFMASNLEPALGALKVTRNLLRRADAEVAEAVELASPLPYFALSWFISLFCHDLEPELSIRAMDWFLVEGPGAAIYVVVALVLSDRSALLQLADDADVDQAEIHHHLAQLPTRVTSSTLQALLEHASELSHAYPLEPRSPNDGSKRKVMGSASVLCTFPALQRRSKAAVWKAKDVHAESILRGPVDRIVVDPTPTPPVFEEEEEEETQDGLYKAPEKLHISKRNGNGGGNAVLLVGAVGAAAAVLLFAATGGKLPPQTIELLKNMALRSR